MKKLIMVFVATSLVLSACNPKKTSNDVQRDRQEKILAEAAAQMGMPDIKNFRMAKLLKYVFELCDKEIVTYTYVWNEFNGKAVFFCNSIGYGIPYAAQLTAPESVQFYNLGHREGAGGGNVYGTERLPQADPDGIFKPASAEGTWVVCKDPNTGVKADPVYIEPRIIVLPFKLPCEIVAGCNLEPEVEPK